MEYVLENEQLRLTVASHGAEPVSVIAKKTGEECLWCGDPAVWGRHAPILFPYTGKLPGGKMTVNGKSYPGGQHGFARDMEHSLVQQTSELLVLELIRLSCVPLMTNMLQQIMNFVLIRRKVLW